MAAMPYGSRCAASAPAGIHIGLSDHSKQSSRIDEQHLQVLRLPVPCYFAAAAASMRIKRQSGG
jgi:hypothetical protein